MAEAQTTSDVMALHEVREVSQPENNGYDAPFGTFTWQHWLDAQAKVNQCFSRFVRAIEEKQGAQALMICLDVQEIATEMLVEAYSLCANVPQALNEQNQER